MVKFDRRVGSCNTLNDLSIKVCVPIKSEHLNVKDSITALLLAELSKVMP